MSKSKLTLVIDGNWLLMSRLSVLNNKYQDEDEVCSALKLLMVKSINVVLRQFPIIDNIIFVADGGSWRNTIEKPKCLTEEYKGTRVPDPNINWDKIFGMYENLINLLSKNGITTCKEPKVEGDDWCWYWSKLLNEEGTNVMIWSRDKDLTQLVKTDKNKCFTICWAKESGIISEEKADEELNFLFNMDYNTNDEIFTSVLNKAKQITYIKPKEVVIGKVIRGDQGDNILPIILRTSKPKKDGSVSEKMFKVSPKDIDNSLDYRNDDDISEYLNNILNSKSYVGRVEKSYEDVFEHFKYNVTMVALEKESYPEEILITMNQHTNYNLNNDLSQVEAEIIAENNSLINVLNMI